MIKKPVAAGSWQDPLSFLLAELEALWVFVLCLES